MEFKWLIDTNILIDFIIGLVNTLYFQKYLEKKVETFKTEDVLNAIKAILNNLCNVEIIVTEKIKNEFRRVLRRHEGLLRRRNVEYRKLLEGIEGIVRNSCVKYQVLDTRPLEENMAKKLRELRIHCDPKDLHIIVAVNLKKPTTVFTDEDAVKSAVREFLWKTGRQTIALHGFAGFLDSLEVINAISREERLLIGYCAYKFQRLRYSHEIVFELGQQKRRRELNLWVKYAEERFQRYLPIKVMFRFFKTSRTGVLPK